MTSDLFQDWKSNAGNLRVQLMLGAFRFAQKLHHLPRGLRWIGLPYLGLYQFMMYWELGIELNYKATIGPRMTLHHGYATVIHDGVIIGSDCVLRQCTTLGTRRGGNDCPVIGDGVDIGSNSVIIGAIRIGDGAKIGAGSVVISDVPAGASVAGNPAKVVRLTH